MKQLFIFDDVCCALFLTSKLHSDLHPSNQNWWTKPRKNGVKRLLNGNSGALSTLFWWRKCCNIFLCSFWIILELDEIGINTCLILKNTLDVTVTALAFQNKTEHPNQVKEYVETVVPNYCDPTFASNFRMKIHFRWRIIHFLPPRLCYDLYDLIFIVNIRFIIADHCCCAMIL